MHINRRSKGNSQQRLSQGLTLKLNVVDPARRLPRVSKRKFQQCARINAYGKVCSQKLGQTRNSAYVPDALYWIYAAA